MTHLQAMYWSNWIIHNTSKNCLCGK